MFIRQSPGLRSRMNVNQREITSQIDGGKIEVRASDVDTLDGVLPTLAIVDELHRHRTADVRGILRLGLGGRHGRMLTISTAGASVDSPLGILRQRAYDMPGFKRDVKRRRSYVRSPDGSFAFIEWALNPDDDTDDLDIVKLVNPRPGRSIEDLAEEKEAVTKGEWLRLICGIWTEGENPWMEPATWDALADKKLMIEDGAEVVVVLDVGAQSRSAALAVLAIGETIRVKVRMFSSEEKLRLDDLEERIRDLCRTYEARWVVYDSLQFERSAEVLEEEGLPMLDVPRRPERMTLASSTIFKLIQEKRLVHDGDPELRAQVLAGRVKETERGWRLAKDLHSPRPIDALIALAIGCHVIATEEPEEPMFGWG
jgi:phage terminase large subunit-like protein